MKLIALALLTTSMLLTAASAGFSQSPIKVGELEEAFIDGVGTCGPSSNVAGSLGRSTDPQVKIALRDALITEAADDAAAVAGSNKTHSDCIRKYLTSHGLSDNDMAALPYCVKHDWPDPFTNLGVCVKNHSRLEGALNKK
ncbi:MAG: hypothetical protein WCE23_06305 [Candidatus Binatus sp.]|uniref:hypothetical protein n=1 Tax=Candidatus Binatus sp. TaxID=2811406 RepID=UPI003C777C3A